jgi:hypothetical protein
MAANSTRHLAAEFGGKGQAPYALITAIICLAPSILITLFRL